MNAIALVVWLGMFVNAPAAPAWTTWDRSEQVVLPYYALDLEKPGEVRWEVPGPEEAVIARWE